MTERAPIVITDPDQLVEASQSEMEVWAFDPTQTPISPINFPSEALPTDYAQVNIEMTTSESPLTIEEQILTDDSEIVATFTGKNEEEFRPFLDFIIQGENNPNLHTEVTQNRKFPIFGNIFDRLTHPKLQRSLSTGD